MTNTVVCNNRLHIANEAHYQGSVNSYNNGFTKLFSRIFRVSSYVTINNEIKCLNKKSYRKFSSLEPRTDLGLMRDNISSKLANKMGEKFIHTIFAKDMEKAKELIGKGAQIDKYYWTRNNGITCGPLTKGLPYHDMKMLVTRLTPFLHAVLMENNELKQLLQMYQANENLHGEGYEFERKIEGVNYHTNVQNYVSPYGYATDISTKQYKNGRDYYRKGLKMSYNPVTNNLDRTYLPDRSEFWSKSTSSPPSGVQVATNALWLGAAVANAFAR